MAVLATVPLTHNKYKIEQCVWDKQQQWTCTTEDMVWTEQGMEFQQTEKQQ